VVSPARAAVPPGSTAPVCDPRGAITFAPPPQIQDSEQSLDIPDIDCANKGMESNDARHVVPSHGAPLIDLVSPDQATASQRVVVGSPLGARLAAPPPVLSPAPMGVRSSIERPPRH
jgi:hypothetical protein